MSRYNFYKGIVKKGQDLSNPYEQTYIELPPYAVDEKGKLINEKSVPVKKKADKINVQEKIQSFEEECNIYTILAKFNMTGDVSYLNQREGVYMDSTGIANNLNDLNAQFNGAMALNDTLPKEIGQKVLDENISNDEIMAAVEAIKKARLAQATTTVPEGENNE